MIKLRLVSTVYPLGPLAVEVFKRVVGDRREGYVFLSPRLMNRAIRRGENQNLSRYVQINKTFDRAVRRLGLTTREGKKLAIHDLRHVFANWLKKHADATVDEIRDAPGHEDSLITRRVYLNDNRMAIGQRLASMPRIRKPR